MTETERNFLAHKEDSQRLSCTDRPSMIDTGEINLAIFSKTVHEDVQEALQCSNLFYYSRLWK